MKKMLFSFLIFLLVLTSFQPEAEAANGERQVKDEIIYNIMVDRYHNGDYELDDQIDVNDQLAYHGGDLQGIIDKLDEYEELGYTAISISPIMANAPKGYHGYWIEDFYELEAQFGEMADLHRLVEEAHDRGIKVIMEFVSNYIASSHPIAEDPEREDWVKGEMDVTTDWSENVEVLNQENPEVQDFLIDVAIYWMEETDIDGFKLHAADQADPAFLETLTAEIESNNDHFYLLADVLDPDAETSHLLENPAIDAVDNYQMFEVITAVFSQAGNEVSDIYQAYEEHATEKDILFVDDFYTQRFTQLIGENGRNPLTVWSLALAYMYTSPGAPSILQGSEIPMGGTEIEETRSLVPFNNGESDFTEFYNRISSLRMQFPALIHGDFEMVGSSGAMSIFKRTLDNEALYIAINNDVETQVVTLDDIGEGMQLRGFMEDHTVRANDEGEYQVGLARESVEIFTVQPDAGLNWSFISFVAGSFVLFITAIIILSRKQKDRETTGNNE
ncbi:alpha-amylase family glycosyl hydrolase [Virgibacillus oceani]